MHRQVSWTVRPAALSQQGPAMPVRPAKRKKSTFSVLTINFSPPTYITLGPGRRFSTGLTDRNVIASTGLYYERRAVIEITFYRFDGTRIIVDATSGLTLMEVATQHEITEIEAQCGGACACATCHVVVDEAWAALVGGPGPQESEMLDGLMSRNEHSRLSCQIKVTAALDGLIVRMPEEQGV